MTLVYLIVVFLAFSVIVLVHEFGHFIAGKMCGVKIEVFSVGVGKRLWGINRGGTDYRISMLPFGGFVAFAGISDTDGLTEDSDDPDSFPSKSALQKIFISLAGPFMNLVTGFILAVLLFTWGVQFTSPEIGDVAPGSPASLADFQKGDRIHKINSSIINGFTDIQQEVALTDVDTDMEFTIIRNGKELKKIVAPVKPEGALFPTIGIYPPVSAELRMNEALTRAGFEKGDVIQKVNGLDVGDTNAAEVVERAVRENPGVVVPIVVKRRDRDVTIEVTPDSVYSYRLDIGIMPAIVSVVSGLPAEVAGIRAGDYILSVNGQLLESWAHLLQVMSEVEGEVKVKVLRGESELEFALTPNVQNDGKRIMGVSVEAANENLFVTWVAPDSAPAKAGITPMQRISSFVMAGNGDYTLTLENGSEYSIQASIDEQVPPMGHYSFEFLVKYETVKAKSFGEAIQRGFYGCVYIVEKTYLFLAKLVSAKLSPTLVSGPVGIINISYRVLSVSFSFFLYFMVLISINLAVVNLLPLPILDGGNIVIFMIEGLKGSPLNPKIHKAIINVGLVMIIGLFLFITGNDIYRLIFGY